MPILDVENKSLSELVADQAKEHLPELVTTLLASFREGEPSAIKFVTQALLENQYSEEDKFPITNDRFKEIINIASDRIRG